MRRDHCGINAPRPLRHQCAVTIAASMRRDHCGINAPRCRQVVAVDTIPWVIAEH